MGERSRAREKQEGKKRLGRGGREEVNDLNCSLRHFEAEN
jgi:hypothetical protein